MPRDHTDPIETAPFLAGQGSAVMAAPGDLDDGFDSPDVFELDSLHVVGRYRIREEIGHGGMGVVLRAYDELLHRDVAIKLLRRAHADQPEFTERFVDEALLTCNLQHPCIVPVYDRGFAEDSRPFFAMKLIAGQSLAQTLHEEPGEQQDRLKLLRVFETVCQTVAFSHSFGILHLDIKPSNIMIGEFGEVHLMDWGLARTWLPNDASPAQIHAERVINNTSAVSYSQPHGIGGTPAYMSPEQARGEIVGPRSDVFGLGGILCEILTGRPPYRGGDHHRVHRRAMHGQLDDANSRLDDCQEDSKLIQLAKDCLQPHQENRIASATEVARAINAYLETALEQLESDVYRFFDLTLDLFCIATMDGYFERVNVNFSRVLGYSGDELISRPFFDFIHVDDVEDTLRVVKDLSSGQPLVHFCNRYRHADGHYLTLEWTAKPLPDEGTIFAVARDVTYRVGVDEKNTSFKQVRESVSVYSPFWR